MRDPLIYLDRNSSLNLKTQLRQKLVDGIMGGAFAPGSRLPSSRKLAEQLDIARNTVVAVYEGLIADGYIVSRERSGIFVSDTMMEQVASRVETGPDAANNLLVWRNRFKHSRIPASDLHEIGHWDEFPYPFIDGKYDASLFPLAEWREASRLALSPAAVGDWFTGNGDADDPLLVHEIRNKFLTRRGIQAGEDEVLVTLGTQNSLFIISQLLADESTTVGIENPGNHRMRTLLEDRRAQVLPLPVDDEGLVVDQRLKKCDWFYTTPSHQIPTAAVMPVERRAELLEAAARNDCLIVEDDYECELSYDTHPAPSLRSMDTEGRVIYVAELAKVLAPGNRLGFIVADAEFIARARELRRALFAHPPLNNQRIAANFLSLGYYQAMMSRLSRTLRERRLELRDALSNMRGVPLRISPEVGGTTYWVKAPRQFNVDYFIEEAAAQGILLEPVKHYYQDPSQAENCFRMGVTSISKDKIVPGVQRLVELIRLLVRSQVEQLNNAIGEWLRGDELQATMSGATILYDEVYGTVCHIELHPDGRMTGRMDTNPADEDEGRWYISGDKFIRRWNRWNYAREAAYYIVIDGDRIKYFNEDRQVVDSGRIQIPQN